MLDLPFALFGHSMGGLIAFELARELRRRARSGPVFLAVSGCPAPQCSSSRVAPVAHLNDAEFLEQVKSRYSAIPEEVLAQPELVELLLPALRADMGIVEAYSCTPEPPLECPIRCFGGTTDHTVPREHLDAWREQTRGPFSLREFPGGHFFLFDSPNEVLAALRTELLSVVPAS
jgi:surfactin synthase thioesterase subunit